MNELELRRITTLLLAGALVGCSSLETRITRPEDQPTTMELQVELPESSVSNSLQPSASVTASDGTNTLNITAVEIVVRELEFRRDTAEGIEPCVDAESLDTDDGDACEEAWVAPDFLAPPGGTSLPVEQGSASLGVLVVPPDTYEGLEFDVHETRDADTNIVTRRPRMVGFSVRVAGTYNEDPIDEARFTPTGTVALPLDDPIDLGDGFASTMVLTVDVASWFEIDGTVVDPEVAAGDADLRAQVRDRIMSSFSIRAGS